MPRRKNTSYTGTAHHSQGGGSRDLVRPFYQIIEEFFPGNTPVPIPPPDSVHPQHDEATQRLIFAQFVFQKIAPLAIGVVAEDCADKLRAVQINQINDREQAHAAEETAKRIASRLVSDARFSMSYPADLFENAELAASLAEGIASHAASKHGGVAVARQTAELVAVCCRSSLLKKDTWPIVNEMLAAL